MRVWSLQAGTIQREENRKRSRFQSGSRCHATCRIRSYLFTTMLLQWNDSIHCQLPAKVQERLEDNSHAIPPTYLETT